MQPLNVLDQNSGEKHRKTWRKKNVGKHANKWKFSTDFIDSTRVILMFFSTGVGIFHGEIIKNKPVGPPRALVTEVVIEKRFAKGGHV